MHNRVSRFTANGDVAVSGSETILLDLDNLSSATNHNGGAMHFGQDGKLYIAVGENAKSSNAQTTANLLGQAPAHRSERLDSDRQSVLRERLRQEPGDLGDRAAQSVHLRDPAGHRTDLRQRRRAGHLGGGQRRAQGEELRMADDRGAHFQSELQGADLRLSLGHGGRMRHHGGHVLQPVHGPIPRFLRRRLLLRRLLRRVDQASRRGRLLRHRFEFRDRNQPAGGA